jgi:DNA-binding HxlR family transcriptional regulator
MGKAKDGCRQSGCPVAYSLDVFGDKWTLVVIRDMLIEGKRHYGEFLESRERIASNILADRLKRLEDAGIVSREADPVNQSKIIYNLTPKGVELIPLLLEVVLWGTRHAAHASTPPEFVRKIKKDRAGTIREIVECLRNDESFVAKNKWV